MASLNKVMIIGNLGRDPEVRSMSDGKAVANATVATTSSWKDKSSGEKKEETEWHRVAFYGRTAEIAGEYLKKGSQVYIEGRLKTRKWQDKESGADRYTTEIICDNLVMLGSRNSESAPAPKREPAAPRREPSKTKGGSFDDMEDDLPF